MSRGRTRSGSANRIVHSLWSIDLEILYTTATEPLPDFVAALRSVVASEFPDA